jgi:hypothetical protein
MSYKNLIDSNLVRAFNLLKDLATDVTFVKKSEAAFDFSTMVTSHLTTTNIVVKAIITDSSKKSSSHNSKETTIMFKSKDLGEITLYDSVIINNATWRIGPYIKDSGYIIIAEITKEV